MTPDLCEGAWSWERALATVRGWQDTMPDPEDCEVTARMVERTEVLLRTVHAAGVPCPQVWRGPSSVMLDWRFSWPRRLPSGEKFRRACIDVEDDTDDEAPYLAGVRGVLKAVQKLDYPIPRPALEEASACVDGLCDDERDRVLARLEDEDESPEIG